MYLLTFQNHGGYEQNDSSLDTVHVRNDFSGLTDDIEEYLSSIKLSGEAFRELTDYFSSVDRNVIICMVGDHAPPFIKDLPERDSMLIEDTSINQRAVPYVIWSNFDAKYEGYTDYVSMVDLAPMVLSAAGLPLSIFYKNILDLHELLPIRTSEGKYVDKDYHVGLYSSESNYYDRINEYYYMEYNTFLKEDQFIESLFDSR